MFGKENSKTLLNQSGRSFIGESMQIEDFKPNRLESAKGVAK